MHIRCAESPHSYSSKVLLCCQCGLVTLEGLWRSAWTRSEYTSTCHGLQLAAISLVFTSSSPGCRRRRRQPPAPALARSHIYTKRAPPSPLFFAAPAVQTRIDPANTRAKPTDLDIQVPRHQCLQVDARGRCQQILGFALARGLFEQSWSPGRPRGLWQLFQARGLYLGTLQSLLWGV